MGREDCSGSKVRDCNDVLEETPWVGEVVLHDQVGVCYKSISPCHARVFICLPCPFQHEQNTRVDCDQSLRNNTQDSHKTLALGVGWGCRRLSQEHHGLTVKLSVTSGAWPEK